MVKVFEILGYGQIEDFIDKEDIDEEDLTDTHQTSSSDDDQTSSSDHDHDHDDKKEKESPYPNNPITGSIPPSLRKKDIQLKPKPKRKNKKPVDS